MMESKQSGPSGGTGGEEFRDDVLPQDYQLVEVHIYAQNQVNAVQIVHETTEGCRHVFPLRGCTVGDHYILSLDSDEFIVEINGYFGNQVNSICVQTNKQSSPLLGAVSGNSEYRYEALPGTEIIGFCGRAGTALDAVGVVSRRRGL